VRGHLMPMLRLLLVTDGTRFHFGPRVFQQGQENFSLTVLVDAFRSSSDPVILVDTAHRRHDPNATFSSFNFATSIPSLNAYDVIWMLGDEGSNEGFVASTDQVLTDDENLAITLFMEAGGGVFAAGDHDGLGSFMCGALPRVRSMRKWWDPQRPSPTFPSNRPALGIDRADTLRPAPDGNTYFDCQSDSTPQPLRAVPLADGSVHPILQVPSGILSAYPDHMHEGEVIAPQSRSPPLSVTGNVTFKGRSFAEYPTTLLSPGPHRELPHVIATGIVLPHHTLIELDYQGDGSPDPVNCSRKLLNILCAYDGHVVGRGRVVTDSSFHHFMDINLIGTPVASSSGGAHAKDGFNTPARLGLLSDLKAFFVNTAAWLARSPLRSPPHAQIAAAVSSPPHGQIAAAVSSPPHGQIATAVSSPPHGQMAPTGAHAEVIGVTSEEDWWGRGRA
jgi:hypothetical protein